MLCGVIILEEETDIRSFGTLLLTINGYIVYKLGEFSSKLPEGALVSTSISTKMAETGLRSLMKSTTYCLTMTSSQEAIEQMQQQMGDDSDENEGQGQGQDDPRRSKAQVQAWR